MDAAPQQDRACPPLAPDLPEGIADELSQILFADTTRDATLDALANLAHRTLPSCIAASVTVAERGKVYTAVSSVELASILDEAQYDTREGPCLDAIRTRQVIDGGDFDSERRWATFTNRVRRSAVKSSLSLPLVVGDEAIGALNLYSGVPQGLRDSVPAATAFAQTASITLANALAYHRAADLSAQLAEALEHRDVIGQAKGLLMAREHISADEAFERLRTVSQRSNRKLYQVAQDLVAKSEDAETTG
jgi:GAF domain-containing protein